MEDFEDPLGVGRRARLSLEETAERMIATGVRLVYEQGLKVSFDLMRLEDVIEAAGVSRSAVYNRWPRKEQFYSQLLLELAGTTHPATSAYDNGTINLAVQIALERLDWLSTAEGRHTLIVEMCRLGALQNFEWLVSAGEWQVYAALHATMLALPDNRFREAIKEALQNTDREFVALMTQFYTGMTAVLGYRLKDDINLTFEDFTVMGAAVVEGLVSNAHVNPDVEDKRFLADPFNTGQMSDWSYAALAYASIALTLIEPDPHAVWDETRLAETEALLMALQQPTGKDSTQE